MGSRSKSQDGDVPKSVVLDVGKQESTCGYCKSKANCSISHGMLAREMSVQDYQDLIDLGWRRSGTYLYKPNLEETCCPPYTIRMHANLFEPSKPQQHLLRKWARHLANGDEEREDVEMADAQGCNAAGVASADGPSQASAATASTASKLQQQAHRSPAPAAPAHIVQALEQLLASACELLVNKGQLPTLPSPSSGQAAGPGGYPVPAVMVVTQKHQKQLGKAGQQGGGSGADGPGASPSGTGSLLLTSPCAFAFSAAARKAGGAAAGAGGNRSVQPPAVAALFQTALQELMSSGASSAAAAGATGSAAIQEAVGLLREAGCEVHAAPTGHLNFKLAAPAAASPTAMEDGQQAAGDGCSPQQRQGSDSLGKRQASRDGVAGVSSKQAKQHHHPQVQPQQRRSNSGNAAAGGSGVGATAPGAVSSCFGASWSADLCSFKHAGGAHVLEVRMAPSAFDQEEFELYKKYQVTQHKDDPDEVTREGYCRFLVETPLTFVPPAAPAGAASTAEVPPCGYGSFHMQYRLDGKLIAVGVVDVLPRCLSSVYLFWDVEAARLAPGKFSALMEIDWVQQASRHVPSLAYYYMGFYIHSCHKMRYKAQYVPSDLLCPETKLWVRISPALLSALDSCRKGMVKLAALSGAQVYPNNAPPGATRTAAATAQAQALLESQPQQAQQQAQHQAQQQQAESNGSAAGQAGSVEPEQVQLVAGVQGLVLSWGQAKTLGLIPKKYWREVTEQLQEWLGVVGGVGLKLGFELH